VTLYPIASTREPWTDAVKRAEAAGAAVVTVNDHVKTGGIWAALVSAFQAAPSLRVGTMVLNNDLWHPAVLAREAITTDVLTDGRLELGIGAGWDAADYGALGLERRSPGMRIERLAETLEVLRQAFAGERISFRGKHYTVEAQERWPRPRQERIPLLVGGGGRRILSLAAERADIVSIHRNLRDGSAASWVDEGRAHGEFPDGMSERVSWVRDAAAERLGALELHATVQKVVITERPLEAATALAAPLGYPPSELLRHPHFLIGTLEEMGEELRARRARWGTSYITIGGGVASSLENLRKLEPLISRLANT
jgi:probable F420-dependent oxidoreductase